jgi:hypothetical protein
MSASCTKPTQKLRPLSCRGGFLERNPDLAVTKSFAAREAILYAEPGRFAILRRKRRTLTRSTGGLGKRAARPARLHSLPSR